MGMTAEEINGDDLVKCVRAYMPDAGEVTLSPIATGKFNSGYFVTVDGRDLVLRVAPPRDSVFLFYERDMMRQEPGLHATLRERTTVPVAKIIAYDDSSHIIDRDYIIMERLPGSALSETSGVNTGRVMHRVGECLAQVHAITAEQFGYLGEHQPMEPQDSWPDAFHIMWCKLLDDVVGTGHYTPAERDALIALLDEHMPLFDRRARSSLLHMDIWGQNILVDHAGELTGLVDWDRALWGDPEIEFAVLDYCGISTPEFWEGYGRPRDESPEARTRMVFYFLYELQKYIVIRHGRSHDPTAAAGYKAQVGRVLTQCFSRQAWPMGPGAT
jgi:aminoglycoside phosphotransferase (APT) family kinase protein